MSTLAQALAEAKNPAIRVSRARSKRVAGVPISLVETKIEETKIEETKISTLAQAIVNALNNRATNARAVQNSMVELITGLATKSKKEVCLNPDLRYIFGQEIRGNDVSSLAQWLGAFTPILVQFDSDTGRFEGITFSQAAMRRAKEEGVSAWNIGKLTDTPWDSFTPTKRKKVIDPSLNRVFESLAREMARKLDTDPNSRLDLLKSEFMRMMDNNLMSKVAEIRNSVKHEEYVTRWEEHQKRIAREGK